MPKAPLPPNEASRLRAIRSYSGLDGSQEVWADEIAAVAATMTRCPIAIITIVDTEQQWFKGCIGLDVPGTPRDQAFCAYTILDDGALIVEDATRDPRFSDNALVLGPPHIRFYAGVPLIDPQGMRLGSLCCIDVVPRTIEEEHIRALEGLASVVMRQVVTTRGLQTAHSRAQTYLQDMHAAESANRLKTDFLAHMSHEIRTPMTAILGYADMLASDAALTPDQRRDCVATISRNGRHLLAIINDVLDISKIEAGQLAIEPIPTNVAALIADIMSLMEVRVANRQVALELIHESSVPAVITTDPVRLKQILVNLLGNAIKFTDEGSVRLRVASTEVAPQTHDLTFEVTDTGIGIAAEHIDRLFTSFCQGDVSMSRRFGGTGLGLTISQRLADMLGGNITVESAVGCGSTFTLRIRAGATESRASEPRPPASDQHAPAHATASDTKPLRGLRVLLAEDGIDNQRLIAHFLKGAGAEVEIADNGDVVLRAIASPSREQAPFDVIVMDMQMPIMDGYATTRRLREDGISIPIIAATAHALVTDRTACLEAGCDDYLSKPIDRHTLVEAVHRQACR